MENAISIRAVSIYEETGVQIRLEAVKESISKRQSRTFEAKISYVGPLNYNRSGGNPRIKFDITNDEILAEDPDVRMVFHPYTDAPNPPALISWRDHIIPNSTHNLFRPCLGANPWQPQWIIFPV